MAALEQMEQYSQESSRVFDSTCVVKRFVEFEKTHNCFSREVDGILYWHFIRYTIAESLVYAGSHVEGHPDRVEAYSRKNIIKKSPKLFLQVIKSYRKFILSKKEQAKPIVLIETGKITGAIGERRAPYVDWIAQLFDGEYVIIERPHNLEHESHNCSGSVVFSDYIEFRWLLARTLKKWKKTIDAVYSDLIILVQEVEDQFDVSLDRNELWNRVEHCVTGYREIQKVLRKVFLLWKPKCVLEIAHYSTFCLVANEVLREQGIPTIELQHGTIGETHYAYNLDAPQSTNYLPDKVATFGQYWIDQCDYPEKETRMIACGFPFFEEKKKQYANEKVDKTGRKNILIVSQGESDCLQNIALDLARYDNKEEFNIIFKLHPSEMKTWRVLRSELVEWTQAIEVVDTTEFDIYYYLNIADYVVGTGSTVMFEAAGFGCSVFVLNNAEGKLADPLVKLGFAQYVDNVSELIDSIQNIEKRRVDRSPEYFWKANALDNLEQLIRAKMRY